MTAKTPWSVRVRREAVPDTGLHRDLIADDGTREAVAAAVGVNALPRLAAHFDIARRGAGLRVVGEVVASVEQTCVVTLEPMTSEIREPVDLAFVPAEPEPEADEMEAEGIEGSIDLDAEDEPELLVDGTVDLGAIAVEFLMLGIDPYPRKPDAVFEAPKVEAAGNHPFEALAALKKDEQKPD